MEITFNTDAYDSTNKTIQRRRAKRLIFVLRNLLDHGQFQKGIYPDIERLMTVPSLALKYVRMVAMETGMSPEGEKIFLKNPSVALQYLKSVKRPDFLDPKIQKRWRRMVGRNPLIALEWCKAFNQRLTEDEEQMFTKDMYAMKDYAMFVIRGPFPQKVHEMILLQSFDDPKGRNSHARDHQKWALQDYLRYAGQFQKS
jgi:hypothetical protein